MRSGFDINPKLPGGHKCRNVSDWKRLDRVSGIVRFTMKQQYDFRLLRWSGVFALVGAGMWTYKSIAILATGEQPDYWFELALVFFGVSILLLIYAIRDRLDRFARLVPILAWLAAVGGAVAGVAYIIGGDDGLFGPSALVTMVSIIVTLFLIGGQILRNQLLPRYSFAPRLLAWLSSLPPSPWEPSSQGSTNDYWKSH